jgi:hypothetical protein
VASLRFPVSIEALERRREGSVSLVGRAKEAIVITVQAAAARRVSGARRDPVFSVGGFERTWKLVARGAIQASPTCCECDPGSGLGNR